METEQELQSLEKSSPSDPQKSALDSAPPVSLSRIYGIIDSREKVILGISMAFAFISGCVTPGFILLMGETINSFGPEASNDEIMDDVERLTIITTILAVVSFISCFIFVTGFSMIAESMAAKLRKMFFSAVLHQEVSWFDANASTEFASRIAKASSAIQNGLGGKTGRILFYLGQFIAGTIIAYTKGARLAAVVTATIPFVLWAGFLFGKSLELMITGTYQAYLKSGGVAEETLNTVKTVASLNSQERQIDEFCSHLVGARDTGIVMARKMGVGMGFMTASFYAAYGVVFIYGGYLIDEEEEDVVQGEKYQPGHITIILFALMIGMIGLAQTPPLFASIMEAKVGAASIFAVVDSQPKVDKHTYKYGPGNPKIASLEGRFEFKNIDFAYPTRQQVPIFKNLSLTIEPHKTTAIVGETGSGKSTIIQLIQKFYTPDKGTVTVDGIPLEDVAPQALREKIGLVSQEPVLFATSIEENLRLSKRDASWEEIRAACKQAQALDFVESLPDKFKSYVGQGGSQLSGGQKQRIAIARALLKQPTILLLDEATSALDNVSEKEVQKAIDNLSKYITQIVIAHRLSTIRNADTIIVIKENRVWEQGTHSELVAHKGVYANLAAYQLVDDDTSSDNQSSSDSEEINEDIEDKEVSIMIDRRDERAPSRKTTDRNIVGNEKDKKDEGFFWRVWVMNKPEQWALYLGLFVAMVNGAVYPYSGTVVGLALDKLLARQSGDDLDLTFEISSLFGLAVVSFVSNILQYYFFGIAGENLTFRIRRSLMRALLKMPIFFFDREENKSGALVTMLETHAASVKNASGSMLGTATQSASAGILAIIIAIAFSWKLGLILSLTAPLYIMGFAAETLFFQGESDEQLQGGYQESGSIVSEAVSNVRTVVAFGCQQFLEKMYSQQLEEPLKAGKKKSKVQGLGFGYSQFSPNFFNGIYMLIGTAMITADMITFKEMIVVVFTISFGAYGSGQGLAFIPDAKAAAASCREVFRITDRKSEVDPFEKGGNTIPQDQLKGQVQFSHVTFKYEGRELNVLHHLDLTIPSGQSVALVGPSGSGKSTVIQLLLRFYLPHHGKVTIDGHDISSLNTKYLRTIVGLVSQEPVLFDTSIEENIRFGKPDATKEEIVEAARAANALEFIEKDSTEGFSRRVGVGGKMLSGGQKQRVAIARVFIRKPTIMLLDEATSALDNESERKVQAALDNVSHNRTTIVIAHRISTIANCDKICVMNHGKVAEEGKHDELLSKDGIYSKLVQALK
mmetsp:Transcript_26696/g.30700  ORF Transcript_26696/g.30700 Transcript_26696/m.30700 type:complete len:1257 (-) Transcript_26696:252-4022(-)